MRVLFITNYPSPYRVDFFNLLGKYVDLTVLFTSRSEEQRHRDKSWFNDNYSGFTACFLNPSLSIFKKRLCHEVIEYIQKGWDLIISGGYSSPTQMLAFDWMKRHSIPFYMELDGGMIGTDGRIKKAIKRHFISMPNGYFSSGKLTDAYLIHYGARRDSIIHYPFTSQWQSDLDQAKAVATIPKDSMRDALGIYEKRVVLGVGQFVYRKGFDILIHAAALLPPEVGVYIVGGEPTEEYLSLCEQTGANNVHFVGFKPKEELKQYYKAADVFAMPTRYDIWGLVVNEALSFGLPVVSSNKCVAALELIENGKNGFIVPVDDHKAMAKAICRVLSEDQMKLSANALSAIRDYSMENMVKQHLDAFSYLYTGKGEKRRTVE